MSSTTRRAMLAAGAGLLAAPALHAQPAFPNKPLRIIVPYPPGGVTDLMGRLAAEAMGRHLGQPVVVENRAGAGGNIGADAVAKADPDGHTLLMATIGTVTINHFLYSRMPFRQEDLTAIARVSLVANGVMVNAQVPARTLQELIALAKRDPGALNYGTPGNGTSGHLCAEYLKTLSGIDITHVPFRGTGGVIPELLAGRVQIAIDNLPAYLPHIASGAVRLLAVTSAEPWFSVPEAPTVAASGFPGFEAVAWFGLQAPARTPRPIIERIAQATIAAVGKPEVQAKLREVGNEPRALGPAEFERFIAAENEKWREVVRRSGARLD